MHRYTVRQDMFEAEREYLNWQVENGLIYGYGYDGCTFYVYFGKEEV